MSTQLMGDTVAHVQATENRTVAKDHADSDSFTDLWLTHHLTQLYGQVANEPLPDELLARLEARFG
ncbi:MAG TPA: hypothetical protein VL899_09325 [Alphaproteobacteria bacterium]|jgi:hypothetical protein|nr:hypothetical protein [Alphaproteobacteria bacterium]